MTINNKVSERLENLVITENHRKWGTEMKSGYAPAFREAATIEDPAVIGPIEMVILKMGNMERIILALKRDGEAREIATRRGFRRGLWIAVIVAIAASAFMPRVRLFSSGSSSRQTRTADSAYPLPPPIETGGFSAP